MIPKNQVNPITHSLDIGEYNCFTNFSPEDENLGASGIRGVAIYTRKRLKIEEVKLDVEDYQDHVYRSPSNDATIEGCKQSTMAVINLIKTAHGRNINLIIAGDFNYKNIDWCNECAKQEYLVDFINTLQKCFLYQHVIAKTKHLISLT